MKINKHAAKLIDKHYINKEKQLYRTITNINVELANIHRNIEFDIDKPNYQRATDYVNQFISYASIWNLKFVHNFEDPEVALVQLFHLEYIFDHEPKDKFRQERKLFNEQYEAFLNLDIYTIQHIETRKQKMFDYINNKDNNSKN